MDFSQNVIWVFENFASIPVIIYHFSPPKIMSTQIIDCLQEVYNGFHLCMRIFLQFMPYIEKIIMGILYSKVHVVTK
jgi:hypothetical protein